MKSLRKALTIFSLTVIFLTLLSYYSHFIYLIGQGDERYGKLARPAVTFATFPDKLELVWEALSGIPPTWLRKDESFQEVNNLTYNLYAINSFWNTDLNRWDIRLFNFKNDSVLYEWHMERDQLDLSGERQFANAEIRNCILLEDKSIIVPNDRTANLVRLDSSSRVMWANHEVIFHHSLNMDADSSIWACTTDRPGKDKTTVTGRPIKNLNGHTISFLEDYITQIDKNTGKILFKKGVSELLLENNYKTFVYGFSNPPHNQNDPVHLNDIEPVLKDSKYWKKGDLFISLRHRSLVFLYRPSTNKIIRLINGPLVNQHDVDIISEKEISIFNNNYIIDGVIQLDKKFEAHPYGPGARIDSLVSSEIVIYNFEDSTFRTHLKDHFNRESIKTYSQGLHETLKNGDVFVEAQNFGKLYIVNEKGIVWKRQLGTPDGEYIYMPHWIRTYEELNF
jgi:hypothetical protein